MSVRYPGFALCLFVLLTIGCQDDPGAGESGPGDTGIIRITTSGVDSLKTSSGSSVVLLNVWASWCAPCIDEMPGLVRLRADYPAKDLDLIMISTDDPDDIDSLVAPALSKAGVKFRTYILATGDDDAFIRSLHPDWTGALPATFITDRTSGGETTSTWFVGERSYDDLRAEVSEMLSK